MEIDLLITDCFLDLAELLETVAQGFIVCMPRKAADAIALVFPFGCDYPASQRSSERYEETNILDKEFGHDECRMSGRDCESIRTEKEKMNGHDARGKKKDGVCTTKDREILVVAKRVSRQMRGTITLP